MASNEKIIKDAQYRKGLSIGFFNATNSAIALVAALIGKEQLNMNDEKVIERVGKIRDILIEQHKDYYSKVIANIGATYDASQTIAKVNSCTTMEELKSIWITFSEDERRDESILKAKELMKKKLK